VIRILAAALLACAALPAAAQTYSNPESVEAHPRLKRSLVSNTGGGNILARADDGTLSVFTSDPSSPYGIELLAGTLFVLDSGRVKGYDIDSAEPVMNLALTGAVFLNGITSNGTDTLYVTDFNGRRVYRVGVADLGAPTQEQLTSTGTATPNGIVYDRDENRLLIATWGSNAKVLSLDLGTPGATPQTLIQTTLGNLDGIVLDCDGTLFVSAWSGCGAAGGCLRRFDRPFAIDSTPIVVADGLASPADIDYDRRTAEILVPESSGARVSLHSSSCGRSLFIDDFER